MKHIKTILKDLQFERLSFRNSRKILFEDTAVSSLATERNVRGYL